MNKKISELPDDITKLLNKGSIFIVSGTYCPYCTVAKKTLDDLGCNYSYVECDETEFNENQRKKLFELTGVNTIPNIFIGKQSIGGSSDLMKYRRDGKLADILRANDVKCTKI